MIFFICSSGLLFSQPESELEKQLSIQKDPLKKLDVLYQISEFYINKRELTNALKYADQALSLSEEINDADQILKFQILIGELNYLSGDLNSSSSFYLKAFLSAGSQKQPEYTAASGQGLAKVSWRMGKYKESIYFSNEALKIYEELDDKMNIAITKGNLGALYIDIEEYDRAVSIYEEILKVFKEFNDSNAVANVYEKLGIVKFYKGFYAHARKYYLQAYDIYTLTGRELEAAVELGNIAETYEMEGNYSKAIRFYKDAVKIELSNNYYSGLIFLYQALGRSYFKSGNKYQAKRYYFISLDYIKKTDEKRELPKIYQLLHELYASYGDYRNAYTYALKANAVKDSISGTIVRNRINELRIIYETDKTERENLDLKKNQVLQNENIINEKEKNKRKNYIITGFILISLMVVVFSFFFYRRYSKNKKTGQILGVKNKQLAKTNQDIKQGITYAGNIQQALLSSFKDVTHNFSDYFVLYEPAHILSGDFYWSKRINDTIFIVVADSTGHGIPGALISILGMSLLNEIIDEDYIQTDTILNNLRDKIKKALDQKGEIGEYKDGWDLSIISLNIETGDAQYSGAFNSIYLISDDDPSEAQGSGGIKELLADRQPVSVYTVEKPFTKQDFKLKKGDIIYLFTDGIIDQLDDKLNKRFTSKRFRELILQVSDKKMNEQLTVIKETFKDWKGEYEQVDDVLVMGLKI
jgi:serine phosphatase RsbU (regulator of sigma subunit)